MKNKSRTNKTKNVNQTKFDHDKISNNGETELIMESKIPEQNKITEENLEPEPAIELLPSKSHYSSVNDNEPESKVYVALKGKSFVASGGFETDKRQNENMRRIIKQSK